MKQNNHVCRRPSGAGFTLPAVLIIVAALLILVVGLLAVSGIERRTARSYVDLQRADMATRAGLEDVKAILDEQTGNDDFLIVSDVPPLPRDGDKNLASVPYLYIAKGEMESSSVKYKYKPLFSTLTSPSMSVADLKNVPDASQLVGESSVKIENVPWLNPAFTAWVPIKATKNGKEQTVARYAFWVEDLQGKIKPQIAGNQNGENDVHVRNEYPFPAPGLNPLPLSEKQPALNGIALYVLDEKSTDEPESDLTKRVIDGRRLMLSPNSILGATGFSAPIKRGDDGLPEDRIAAALEKNLSPVIHAYDEKPMIPFSRGISGDAMGKPKLNLNKMLSENRDSAISEFASHIENALPNFKDRQGGFDGDVNRGVIGDDYLKTLAANAFDYADEDSEPSLKAGVYRGLDAYPLMSEIVLKVDYEYPSVRAGRLILNFRFRLFTEMWNMTNIPTSGTAQVSYEVALNLSEIGVGTKGRPFDDPSILNSSLLSTHDLQQIDGRFYTRPFSVDLLPDEYRFFEVANVKYTIDVGPNNISYETEFNLEEKETDARGLSFRWNNVEVERISKIVRDPFGMTEFKIKDESNRGKAAIPGHTYGPYGQFINNMGDPRMSHYFRFQRLGENSYPSNISPNRRNIRRGTIYDRYGDRNYYGRVLPSEWPDRGHDASYGGLATIPETHMKMYPADPAYNNDFAATKLRENAPQRISNAGRFYSATELGRIYDPIMWSPHYDDIKGKPGTGVTDTRILVPLGKTPLPQMPANRNVFPDVTLRSTDSLDYGGGNSLRIGRYEHKRFDVEAEGKRAALLLDLFHTGKSTSDQKAEREGDVVTINGQININTASKDTLRVMAAGMLKQDPEMRKVTKWGHAGVQLSPTTSLTTLGTPTKETVADVIADAIIERRPFSGMGELASIKNLKDDPVFGNLDLYENQKEPIIWTDAAAEELFARIHDAGTFRSRNFRVWVIGQSVSGAEENLEVLAETRKVFTVFADPGERNAKGEIKPANHKSRVTYESNF